MITSLSIGVGDGAEGICSKIQGIYFSGKYHVKYCILLIFSYVYFPAKCLPPKLTMGLGLGLEHAGLTCPCQRHSTPCPITTAEISTLSYLPDVTN